MVVSDTAPRASGGREIAMRNPKHPREVDNRTFEAVRKFVEVAREEDIAALREKLARQAELMRRHGDDKSAEFFRALADGLGALGRSAQCGRRTSPRTDAA